MLQGRLLKRVHTAWVRRHYALHQRHGGDGGGDGDGDGDGDGEGGEEGGSGGGGTYYLSYHRSDALLMRYESQQSSRRQWKVGEGWQQAVRVEEVSGSGVIDLSSLGM